MRGRSHADALGYGIHRTENELRGGKPLVSGEAIPPCRLSVVLWHAPALDVHEAEPVLRSGVALVGQRPKKPEGGRVVPTIEGCQGILSWPGNSGAQLRQA